MTTWIATLNIRQGGSKHAAALATRLLGYHADIPVITEFRANAAGERLINRLAQAGYDTSHADVAPNVNTVVIAARGGVERSWAFDDALDRRHLWCAEIDGAFETTRNESGEGRSGIEETFSSTWVSRGPEPRVTATPARPAKCARQTIPT
ncbi:hypothetical protein [Mycolicibacterium bacteremicum]|uniref:hypothetical protein n=1 Tax=Mycolicibacterium bacteremicum TaxID=564198 RepID=UPI001A995049|nr:hypothetical protein [Mycolicibacterium bacteremicum]MCV7434916.1 hypothetical protein [Mycolicibacterium bacteremicum]